MICLNGFSRLAVFSGDAFGGRFVCSFYGGVHGALTVCVVGVRFWDVGIRPEGG
jgi:hypothetical protein